MEDDVGRLERALVDLLRLGNVPRVYDLLTERAPVRLPRAALVVLAAVDERGPVRLSDLAADLAVDLSTASRHVARLARAGLLERVVDDDDHRAALLSLSAVGRRTLADIRAARHEAFAALLDDWSPAEVRRLAVGIERLNRVLVARSCTNNEGGGR